MTYDGASQTVVLFGGHEQFAGRGEELDDTWVWNGTAWKQRSPAVSPPPRQEPTMAYDAVSRTVVLFGGTSEVCGVVSDDSCAKLNDTWTWDGIARTWTQHVSPVSPAPRSGASMAYDKVSQKVVLFGGKATNSAFLNDTWTWDGNTRSWSPQTPPSSPPARYHAAMAPQGRGLVLFSGGKCSMSTSRNDTWTWDGTSSTWTEQTPPTSPALRGAGAMAYDAARQRAVLFSGFGGCCTDLTDTWLWNGTEKTWTLAATTGPEARYWAGIAYDAARQRVVLFGGQTAQSGETNDTWIWNGVAWKQKA